MKKRLIGILLAITLILQIILPTSVISAAGSDLVPLTERETVTTTARYTVLVLDISGSMNGTPIAKMKESANNFVDDIMKANGENYIALVTIDSFASIKSDFVGLDKSDNLKSIISGLRAGGGTDTAGGLRYAGDLLKNVPNDSSIARNILLLTDGLPNSASSALNVADELKTSGYSIYGLGFFHNYINDQSARDFVKQVQNAGYYDVVEPNELKFTFGEIANQILKIKGSFKYGSPIKKEGESIAKDYSEAFYYDDSFFEGNSYDYNHNLAIMSLCLELSAWNSNDEGRNAVRDGLDDYTNKSVNSQKLFADLGFSGIAVNKWFTSKPETDSIGAIAACKEISFGKDQYTLIALAVRGGGYEAEWASNFTLGSKGQHSGFRQAKDNVIKFLKEYISYYKITGNIKLWITGYSRAAATANLIAGAIDDGISLGSCAIKPENMYAYTFETPKGALLSETEYIQNGNRVKKEKYNNIFNIINPDDLVTYVAPENYKFGRFGIDKVLPTNYSHSEFFTLQNNMLKYYNDMDSTNLYTINSFKRYKINWSKFLPGGKPFFETIEVTENNFHPQSDLILDLVDILANEAFISRELYASINESGVRFAAGTFMSGTLDEVTETFSEKLKNNIVDLLWAYLKPFGGVNSLTTLVAKYLQQSFDENGLDVPSGLNIGSLSLTIANLLARFISCNHADEAVSAIMNCNRISEAHYPELCLSWLKAYANHFDENVDFANMEGFYRIIRINCPIDVDVFNSKGNKVGSIINSIPQDIKNGIVTSVDSNGEKLIYLPGDEEYRIEMVATDDGKMTYSIHDNKISNSVLRIINYPEISIEKGDKLSSVVQKVKSSKNLVDYIFMGVDNEKIDPAEILTGVNAEQAQYTVTLNTVGNGIALGGGKRYKGEYAKFNVVPREDTKFLGWYINNNLVSEELEYRMQINDNVEITAKFTENSDTKEQYNVNVNIVGNGSVDGAGKFFKGEFAELTAKPSENSEFFGWFINNKSVSNDIKYRFEVTEDIEIIAKFAETSSSSSETTTTTDTNATNPTIPNTGDDSNPLFWIIVMIISFGIIAGSFIYYVKKKKSMIK